MRRSDRGSVGSATVEFALVLPLVLVVVLALVQVGLLVRDRLLVEAAARAAARAAAVQDDPDAITSIDLSRAIVVSDAGELPATVLIEEVEKRTGIRLNASTRAKGPVIAIKAASGGRPGSASSDRKSRPWPLLAATCPSLRALC